MQINEKFGKLADRAVIEKVTTALKDKGVRVKIVQNGEEARKKILEIIPRGAEVMNMTSVTLETIGIPAEINESGNFNSVRNKLNALDPKTDGKEMRARGASPEWVLGSVHALTENAEFLIASATGSQLPAYAYGAGQVVLVIGTQKIVKNVEEGLKRIYEYSFPLEDERALKAYGMHSGVNKILIVNREFQPGRVTVILAKETLGF